MFEETKTPVTTKVKGVEAAIKQDGTGKSYTGMAASFVKDHIPGGIKDNIGKMFSKFPYLNKKDQHMISQEKVEEEKKIDINNLESDTTRVNTDEQPLSLLK